MRAWMKAGRWACHVVRKDGYTRSFHVRTVERLFCKLGSDGMTVDSEGNVYLTGKGVTVFDKAGKKIEAIAVPEPWTANVCFGGKDRTVDLPGKSPC